MNNACTIFSSKEDYIGVVKIIKAILRDHDIKVIGPQENWSKIVVKHSEGMMLTFTSKKRLKPGDSFSKLILGTLNFFYKIETENIENKNRIIRLVESSNWAIGIVGDPEFNQAAHHFECIFEVTKFLEGLIFNGIGMVDPDGLMILDKTGSYD